MLKFLRKHTKWMLVVFGVFLMIAFVAPEAINNLGGNPATRAVATIGTRKITPMDMQRAAFEVQALERLSPLLVRGVLGMDPDPEHWLLLTHAAERAGLVGGPDDGEQWLPALATQLVQTQFGLQFGPQTAQQLMMMDIGRQQADAVRQTLIEARPQIAGSSGMSLDDLDRTIAKARGVVRLRNLYMMANRVSRPRAIQSAEAQQRTVFGDILMIEHQRVAGRVPEPSEAQLRAHFERFRDIPAIDAPNAGSRPADVTLPFGYLRPAGVKIATLQLDRTRVLGAVRPDPVEVNKRWRQNRDLYPGEFAEERLRAESSLRDELAARVIEEADAQIRAEVLRAVRRLPQDGPYYRLPANWREELPNWDEIARAVVDAVERSTGVRMPTPTVEILDAEFLSIAEVRRLPTVAGAQVRIGARQFPLGEFLFGVRELDGVSELGLQVGVPYLTHPAIARNGEVRIYFTVLDARPESSPEFDEVRDIVRDDVIRMGAYDILQAQASELVDRARSVGLAGVADWLQRDAPPGIEPPVIDPRVSVQRDQLIANAAAVLDVPEFREAVVDASEAIDPRLSGGTIPSEQAFIAIPVDAFTGLVLMRIEAVHPPTAEDFEQGIFGELAIARQRELFDAQAKSGDPTFSFDRLAERLDYRLRDGSPVRRAAPADNVQN